MLRSDNIFTSSDLGVRKPDARTLQYLAQKLGGVLTRRFMFIGDSKEDMLAASRTKSVGIHWLHKRIWVNKSLNVMVSLGIVLYEAIEKTKIS